MYVITESCYKGGKNMDWVNLWINLLGRTELFGLNIGFWFSMIIVALIVVIMNVVFWGMKPKKH